jgi:hypothetical protein
MKDLLWDEFQEAVQEGLVRHRSILDVVSKFQDSGVRVSRAIYKAATNCGCIRINTQKPQVPPDISLQQLKTYMDDHVEGELCPHCREVLEDEIGRVLFYMAAMANLLDLNVYDVLIREHKKVSALGMYHMA